MHVHGSHISMCNAVYTVYAPIAVHSRLLLNITLHITIGEYVLSNVTVRYSAIYIYFVYIKMHVCCMHTFNAYRQLYTWTNQTLQCVGTSP